jgi:hypothetical protein
VCVRVFVREVMRARTCEHMYVCMYVCMSTYMSMLSVHIYGRMYACVYALYLAEAII